MNYDRRVHLVIVFVGVLALLLNVFSLAGDKWFNAKLYTSGIFYGCGSLKFNVCSVLNIVDSLNFIDVGWFYIVRVLLTLSVPMTITGIIYTFLLTHSNHDLITCCCLMGAVGSDFYMNVVSAILTILCGIPSLITIVHPQVQTLYGTGDQILDYDEDN